MEECGLERLVDMWHGSVMFYLIFTNQRFSEVTDLRDIAAADDFHEVRLNCESVYCTECF